jgi:FHS family L-fucose permease-like MFS transporter
MTNKIASYALSFVLVTSLFFLWAFVHNLEPILIPHLKKACQLTDLQSALIDSAVYLGYFVMAIPAGIVMKKYGFRRGIIIGLLLYAFGAFLFIPAASTRMYIFFLGALFIIASGCTFLETVANPYVTLLGDPKGATTRLNLSQSFNGLGAFVAPILGGQFILSGIELTQSEKAAMSAEQMNAYLQGEANTVQTPYLIIGLVVLVVAVLFIFIRTPEPGIKEDGVTEKRNLLHALRHAHLRNGVIAQFFYVGAQVCVTSFFIRFAKYSSDVPEKSAAFWLSMAMLGFMLGRFIGTLLTRYIAPNRLLTLYSIIAAGLLGIAIVIGSGVAMWAIILVPFFESIMFPTIFSLAIQDLKEDTELGSSLVVMSIVGGAFAPLLMGWISDQSSIQVAYIVPLLCLLVVTWFGARGYKVVE